jgi:hypothetical protein
MVVCVSDLPLRLSGPSRPPQAYRPIALRLCAALQPEPRGTGCGQAGMGVSTGVR